MFTSSSFISIGSVPILGGSALANTVTGNSTLSALLLLAGDDVTVTFNTISTSEFAGAVKFNAFNRLNTVLSSGPVISMAPPAGFSGEKDTKLPPLFVYTTVAPNGMFPIRIEAIGSVRGLILVITRSRPISFAISSITTDEPEIVKGYGNNDGASEGVLEGLADGKVEGCDDGEPDGAPDGLNEGALEGFIDGVADGALDGAPEGDALGLPEGDADG
jgi:hypothetical protein